MKAWNLAWIVVGICTGAGAANDPAAADLMKQARAEQRALAKAAGSGGGGGVSAADVGDADSFGRNVRFLGVAQTGTVSVQPDCTPDPSFPPGPDDRCFVPGAQPATEVFEARDIGRIKLPARASNSLLCHAVTSLPFWHFSNATPSPGVSSFRYAAFVKIDNEVLNDPALIDPTTGAPFNGSLEVGFTIITDGQTVQPGDQASRRMGFTRGCIAGLINKTALTETFGLTAAQADDFFKKPMTLHLTIQLGTRFVDFASVLYGLRLYGD
jgi:hypothetical protein